MKQILDYLDTLPWWTRAIAYIWMFIAPIVILVGNISFVTAMIVFGTQLLSFFWTITSDGKNSKAFKKLWRTLKKPS